MILIKQLVINYSICTNGSQLQINCFIHISKYMVIEISSQLQKKIRMKGSDKSIPAENILIPSVA